MKSLEHSTSGRCARCESWSKEIHFKLFDFFYNLRKEKPCVHLSEFPKNIHVIKLFQIDDDGNDRLSESFFKNIYKDLKEKRIAIYWSGLNNGDIGEFYVVPKR